jgi:hypothetical protein
MPLYIYTANRFLLSAVIECKYNKLWTLTKSFICLQLYRCTFHLFRNIVHETITKSEYITTYRLELDLVMYNLNLIYIYTLNLF